MQNSLISRDAVFITLLLLMSIFQAKAATFSIDSAEWDANNQTLLVSGHGEPFTSVELFVAGTDHLIASGMIYSRDRWRIRLYNPVIIPCSVRTESGGSLVVAPIAYAPTDCIDADTLLGTINNLPVISGSPQTDVLVGNIYSFTSDAADADVDTLNFTINSHPASASFTSSNDTLSGTPTSTKVGVNRNIVVSVSDGTDTVIPPPFSITVIDVNSAPTISGTPSTSVTAGELYSFTPIASDLDGDTLSFSISDQPAWISFNSSNGTLSGTPASTDVGVYSNIVISVSDGTDSAMLDPFNITVIEVTTEPVHEAPVLISAAVGETSVVLSWIDYTVPVAVDGYDIIIDKPEGGYDMIIASVEPITMTYTISDLDTSVSHCFTIQARYFDTDQFLVSNELCTEVIKPPVMVMMDNSGSMKYPMYDMEFDSANDYYGIFEATKNYTYDPNIAVNNGAYMVLVDSSKTGAFVESNCIPSVADKICWSGNFLNWLTTRRIDASRMVLVGGKLESTTSYAYGGNYSYKIVANNEYADPNITKSAANSASWSPVANGATIMIYSPANTSGGASQATYDPYAKIAVGSGGGIIYNTLGTVVGEFGFANINAIVDEYGNLTSWKSITLENAYTNPVVIARPPTQNGGDPSVVRIRNVTSSGFEMSLQEWWYEDGNHMLSENVAYIVMESGNHVLPNSIDVKVGSIDMNEEYVSGICGKVRTDFRAVNFSAPSFISTPVVLSSIMTFNDIEAVTSRVLDVTTNGFIIALQEGLQADTDMHSVETVGYMAFKQGSSIDVDNEWAMEAGKFSGVTHNYGRYIFSSTLNGISSFLAAMQTINDSDTAALRLDALDDNNAVTLQVEEETSCDADVRHTAEDVGYVVFSGTAALNLALAVIDKPTGLLQDIADRVRLGISFHRYNPDVDDIYNQNIQGGTIRFKIPKNPFVKNPPNLAEGGYFELDGYIGTPINDIVDAVNKYPLVWGTTPLAENLWEVIQYFEQETPYYPDVINGFSDFDLADAIYPERDPFYYPEYGTTLFCANPSVVIFSGGEPYKDADIPAYIVDYDADSHQDDVGDVDPNIHGKDNLDDVAYWAFCNKSEGVCPVPGTPEDGTRDLRDDLSGDQYLTIYTVDFAGGAISQILQDTADNAGGQAYAAVDGQALKDALQQMFTTATSRASASCDAQYR